MNGCTIATHDSEVHVQVAEQLSPSRLHITVYIFDRDGARQFALDLLRRSREPGTNRQNCCRVAFDILDAVHRVRHRQP